MNSIYNALKPIDFIVVIIYLVLLFGLGYYVSFIKKRKEGENLFLAQHSLGWPSIGLNMWGTNVGPSMLIASASIGYSTGVVAGNFAWYAFVFIGLLAMVFAPKYLKAKISTLPEYMGLHFGPKTRNILAWYTLITILISWLSLGLFAGGILVQQLLNVPMWTAVLAMIVLATFFAAAGGLKAIAYTNVFQMILLIAVSLLLVLIGIEKVGGMSALIAKTPKSYWNLFLPASDANYPWIAIILGYPVMGVWFWCTEQSMVQSVLGAKNLEQGQLGANFIGWLKILDVPLFILPGILCFVLFPHLKNPDEAYLVMVTQLFPEGMKGLIIVVLIAALVSNIGSALNSVSTVYTMDIYVKKYKPEATTRQTIAIGRWVTVFSAIISVLVALAINSIKGLNLFDVFQSILGFLAPPMSVVFLFGVLWKKSTAKAVNVVLTLGTAFSVFIGVLYLWVFPAKLYPGWPHFLLLSFYIFVILSVLLILISRFDKQKPSLAMHEQEDIRRLSMKTKLANLITNLPARVKWSWLALVIVMILLYIVFNGH